MDEMRSSAVTLSRDLMPSRQGRNWVLGEG